LADYFSASGVPAIWCLTVISEKSKKKAGHKMKNGILWLLVVAFLASVGFLFLANRQKVEALDSARESKQQAADLQAQVDQLKSSIADSQNAELSRLRADNQDLPRLRNQVTQLQAANRKLTQQLQAILATAQDQQTQLEKYVAEKQQTRAAAQASEAESERDTCINNLRQIDAAKNEWALENNKTADAIPTAQDIAPYIKLDANGNIPGCPSGGTYTIGAVGVPPTCSIPGHVLPQ
jgi:septal ring factor EnvC (AmiA/AmiB activator)